MSTSISTTNHSAAHISTTRATTDTHLIQLFLDTKGRKSQRTRRTYETALTQFFDFVGVNLRSVKLDDMVEYADHLASTYSSAATRNLKLSAVKSLLTFATQSGYLPVNVGAPIEAESVPAQLTARIVSEEEMMQLINAPTKQRDRVLLRLLYASGGRVSEVAALTWTDVTPNGDTGSIRIVGKGGKERYTLLSAATWRALIDYRPADAAPDASVFTSQKGGPLSRVSIFRIVKNAGKRAGLPDVSPHWFRHAHASHSLDRGASIALVKETLGHANISTTNKYLHAKPNDSSALHLAV